jgi:hypothetical protein
MARFAIGTAVAGPGEKAQGGVRVAVRPDGTDIRMPILLVNGAKPGPTLVVDAGIHGDEYEGMEAIHRVYRDLDPAELVGVFIGVPVVNVPAFEAGARANPFDRYSNSDLNRNFPGLAHGALSERTAYTYFNEVVKKADCLITFHSGGNVFNLPPKITYEETSNPELNRKTFEITKAFGVDVLWKNLPHDGMLARAAVEAGIPTTCPEVGGSDRVPERREAHVTIDYKGILSVIRYLGMLPGEPIRLEHFVVMEGESHIYANYGGIMRYEPEVRPKAQIKEGQIIGRIVDMLGNEVEVVRAQWDGIVTTMRTMPLIYTGDWFIGIGRIVEEY